MLRPCCRKNALFLFLTVAALVFAGCGSDKVSRPQAEIPDPIEDPEDLAPPLPPVGLCVPSQFTTKFLLDWDDNAEPDLAGYRVYQYLPDPDRETAYVCLSNTRLLSRSSMTIAGVTGTEYIFRVTAVDASGNESPSSETFVFEFRSWTTPGDTSEPGSDSDGPRFEDDTKPETPPEIFELPPTK